MLLRLNSGVRLLCGALLLLLIGCTQPHIRNDRFAALQGFEKQIVEGAGHRHVVYLKAPAEAPRWHVYLEGDGRPWLTRQTISPDPTEADPVALRLFALDPRPGIYLARPCYQGLSQDPDCHPWLWTHGRYSEEVIDSMVQTLIRLAEEYPVTSFTLIGHSGGGTLALLLAERLDKVTRVITLGANVDTEDWARLHRFTPLKGSQSPARRPPLPDRIIEYHLVGAEDRVVSPEKIRAYAARKASSRFMLLPDCGHGDCWEEIWTGLLKQISDQGDADLSAIPSKAE